MHQVADALSRLETNGHDTVEINDDLPGHIAIGVIADNSSTLDLCDTYDDQHPYLDTDRYGLDHQCDNPESKSTSER